MAGHPGFAKEPLAEPLAHEERIQVLYFVEDPLQLVGLVVAQSQLPEEEVQAYQRCVMAEEAFPEEQKEWVDTGSEGAGQFQVLVEEPED